MTKKSVTCSVFVAGFAAAFAWSAVQPAEAQRQSIRFATSDTGSYGYSVGSLLSQVLERNLEGDVAVTVQPYPSTTAAMKAVMDGDGEFSYTANVGMTDLAAQVGPYAGYEPAQGPLVHTLYVYPMETFMAVPAANAGNYSSYADLDGKPVFFTPAGYMNWLNMSRVFNALGYEFNHVEIDSSTTADALEQGSIEAAAAYTTGGSSLPTYWREAELRADISILNFSAEEVEKLQAAGLTPVEVDPTVAFTQDLETDTILGVPIWFAYNVRADMDADLVQQIITILYENVDQLAEGDAGFAPLARDFIGAQTAGIAANPDLPVHAGLAAFLQEHGAWDDSWTIAEQEG